MFVSYNTIDLYGKTVYEDLLTRSGPPGLDSVCPFQGQQALVTQYFPGFNGSMSQLMGHEKDYDVDKIKPDDNEYSSLENRDESFFVQYDPAHPEKCPWHRHFEDIQDSWAVKILGQAMYQLKNSASGSYKMFLRNHELQRVFKDEESGDARTEAELMKVTYNPAAILQARERLPYILKKLFDYGKVLQIHTFSIIIAYEAAQRQLEAANASKHYQSDLKRTSLFIKPLFLVDYAGNFVRQLNSERDASNKYLINAIDWVAGRTDESDAYPYIQEYIQESAVLGIDICDEDPAQYTKEWIESLCCSYIATNAEYLSKAKHVHTEVLAELQKLSITDWNKTVAKAADVKSFKDIALVVWQRFADLEVSTKSPVNELAVQQLLAYHNIFYNTEYNNMKLRVENGIYVQHRGTPILINIDGLSNVRGATQAFVTTQGYLVAIADGSNLYCCPIAVFNDTLYAYEGHSHYLKWEILYDGY